MSSPSWDYIAKLVCIGDSGCGKSSLTIRLCEGRFVAHHDVTIGVEFGSRIVPVGPPHFSGDFTNNSSSSAPLFSPEHDDDDRQQTSDTQSADQTTTTTTTANPTTTSSPSKPTSPPASTSTSQTPKSKSKQKGGTAAAGLPLPPTKPVPPPPQKHMKLSLWDTAGQETYKSVTRSYFRGASGALLVFDLSRRSTFLHVTDWLADLRQIAEPDIVVVLVGNKADLVNTSTTTSAGQDEGAGATTGKREVSRQEAEDWARQNGVLEYVETSAKSGENVENAFCRVAERIYQNIQAGKYDLNDRRSGVKGPSAGAQGSRQVKLTADGAGKGYGGCC